MTPTKRIRGHRLPAEVDVLRPTDQDESSEWDRIVSAMGRLGLDPLRSGGALASYCRAYGQYIKFERSRVRAT